MKKSSVPEDRLDIDTQEGRTVVELHQWIHGRYRLEDLLAQIPDNYEPGEEDWGVAMGREAW